SYEEKLTMQSKLTAENLIRDVPDFPQPGIIFKDITPALQNADAFAEVVDAISDYAAVLKPDLVAGIESRGFILGAPVAIKLSTGLIPVRKAGKLPYHTISCEYALEYGTSTVEIHTDAISPGQR